MVLKHFIFNVEPFFQDVINSREFRKEVHPTTMTKLCLEQDKGYTAPNAKSVKCMPLLQILILHTNSTTGLILDKVA